MTSDEDANNEIPELIESLEPRLTVPDPGLIRSEAGRRRTVRQRLTTLSAVALVVAILGTSWAFGRDQPSQTETVAADSSPRLIGELLLPDESSPSPTRGTIQARGGVDPRRQLEGSSFRVRSIAAAPITLQPDIGHLSFDREDEAMAFTIGCEGASYTIEWASEGLVIVSVNPAPFISPVVACLDTRRLSPFQEGDEIVVQPGESAGSYNLMVFGETTWTMSISGSGDPNNPVDASDLRWEEVNSKIGGDNSPTAYWTGEKVLILNTENWGGDIIGELWDPVSNSATEIGATGLIWRVGAATAWTGDEVLMVGGSNGPGIDRIAVAYRPETDTWRDIAAPPGVENEFTTWVGDGFWTGDELVVPQRSVAYNPLTDAWRAIAEWPFGDARVGLVEGTSDGVLVWGGCTGPPQCDETSSGLVGAGAFYSYSTDTWSEVSRAPLPPAVHVVGTWTGTEMVVVVTDSTIGAPAAAVYEPLSDAWRELPPPPISVRRASASVLTRDRVVVWGGQSAAGALASGAYFDLLDQQWYELPDAPQGSYFHVMVGVEDGAFVSGARPSTPMGSRSPQLLRMPERGAE